ncbi:MATE family efflux transporter [Bacteroides intestinalis]|uniref:hypothetical protein n=1 Tax=Bacteroides intestinalis TaxID=329854 RepID=UPI0011C37F11|nr:hypothetical protein [Bacteroides intestinalis]
MKENTNKILFTNTIILHVRLIITSICGLLTIRFALQALGIVDYGLFSVIGGIISFISLINTIMVSTSNRFIAVAIGKNDIAGANKVFNICFKIHVIIALATLIIAYPIGIWYIYNCLNYSGNINNALFVYIVSITASIFSFITVPYHGLLTAKERFFVFCIPDIIFSVFRLILAIILVSHFNNKLIIYSSFMSLLTLYPCLYYMYYCRKNFVDIVRWKKVCGREQVKEIISFTSWVAYGAVAYVGKNQGAALLVNAFFNTVMNTALGVANSINSVIGVFSRSITQPIEPQITKSFASGDRKRCDYLLIISTKFSYLAIMVVASPFLVDCEWILSLWLGLGHVPPFAKVFTILIIIDTLIEALNSGVKSIIFASGKIKLFQILPSTIKLLGIVGGYFVLKAGYSSYSLFYIYIVSSIIVVFANQWILYKTVGYDNKKLFWQSYFPSILVTALFIPIIYIGTSLHPLLRIILSVIYLIILVYFFALSDSEKEMLKVKIISKFR